jgi:hypothetical protein
MSRPLSRLLSRHASRYCSKDTINSQESRNKSVDREEKFLKSIASLSGGSKMVPSSSVQIPFVAKSLEDLKSGFIQEIAHRLSEIREVNQKEIDNAFIELCYVIGAAASQKFIDSLIPGIAVGYSLPIEKYSDI